MFLQPLVGHRQPGAAPVEKLRTIRLPGAKDKNRPRERIFAQVDGLGRHRDPHPVRREDHGLARNAVRRRMIWNSLADFGAEGAGSSGSGYAA